MRKILAVIGGLTMAVLAVASCGGGGSSGNSSSSSNAKNAEFTKLYNKRNTAKARVTYENHGSDGAVTDTWTIAQDGNGKVAYITKDHKTVVDGNTVWECDTSDNQTSCEQSPLGADAAKTMLGALGAGFFGFEQVITQANADIAKVTDQTIAGRSAKCSQVTVGGAAKSGIAKSILNATGIGGLGWQGCVDTQTGFLLEAKALGDKNDKSELIATKFEDPTSDDFATPTTTTTTEASSDNGGSGGSTDTTDTTDPSQSVVTAYTTDTTIG